MCLALCSYLLSSDNKVFPASDSSGFMELASSGPKATACVHSNWEDLEKCCSDCVCTGIWLKHKLSPAGLFPSPPTFPAALIGAAAQCQPWEAAHELCRW